MREVGSEHVFSVARRVAGRLAADGAEAVVLVGSHARGDAGPTSDIDLLAVGEESYLPRLDVREDLLVSVSVQPFAVHRESFGMPEMVCEAVPGWRGATVLHDPQGRVASLIREAREWTWGPLKPRCDAWVAEEVTARAQTVHKLLSAKDGERLPLASVKRYLLVTRLTPAIAVHRRVLFGSESRLWRLVADAMGEEWGRAQSAALGENDEGLEEGCVAALRLYALAAREVQSLLDDRQRRVVHHARLLADQSARR